MSDRCVNQRLFMGALFGALLSAAMSLEAEVALDFKPLGASGGGGGWADVECSSSSTGGGVSGFRGGPPHLFR